MSKWDKWLGSEQRTGNRKNKRDFDDYDGEMIEKSKSKRKAHRSRQSLREDEFDDRMF